MNSALIRVKRDLSQQNLKTLKPARSKAQQTAGHYANGYWLQLLESIQQASDNGITRNMYEAIKQVIDKPGKKSALLKSKTRKLIRDKKQTNGTVTRVLPRILLQRKFRHIRSAWWYWGYVSTETAGLNLQRQISEKPLMFWRVKKHRVKTAYQQRSSNVVSQPYWNKLLSLLNLYWRKDKVPQGMRNAMIITLYKNKSDWSNCNNYQS